jgi:DNA-packaging protein gp3
MKRKVSVKKEPKSDVGRPTLYKPEHIDSFLEYFGRPPYEERLKKVVTKQGDIVELPVLEANDFPTLAGFAIKLGVHRDTLHQWSQQYPEFSDVYKRSKDFQENFVTVNGNKGLINTTFGIFTAKNILKWRDRFEEDEEKKSITINNYSNLTEEELDARITYLKSKDKS